MQILQVVENVNAQSTEIGLSQAAVHFVQGVLFFAFLLRSFTRHLPLPLQKHRIAGSTVGWANITLGVVGGREGGAALMAQGPQLPLQ